MKWEVRPSPLEWEWSAISILKEIGEEGKGTARHAPRAESRAPHAAPPGIRPFPLEWEWSARHFPLLLGARVDPPLHPPTSLRRKWPTPTFHSKVSSELAPFLLSEVGSARFLSNGNKVFNTFL